MKESNKEASPVSVEKRHNTFDEKEIYKTLCSFHFLQIYTEREEDKNSKGKKGTVW